MRVKVGDLVEYGWGNTTIAGIVLQVLSPEQMNMWGGTNTPEFTMKLFELDSTVSVWDVWPKDTIVILSEARRPGQDQVLNDTDPVVSVRNHLKRGSRSRVRGQVFSGNST